MIPKKNDEWRSTSRLFLITILFLLIFATSSARAQELTPVSVSSVGADKTLGTPVDEIISAVDSGGLSGAENLSALKQDDKKQTLESSIAADPPPPTSPPAPAFSSDSLKDLESQGGLSSAPQAASAEVPTVFNLAVKFFEQVVFKKDVEFASRPVFDKGLDISGQPTFDKDTAGYAIIQKGNQSVEVDFDHDYDSPPVVTATLSLQQYKDPDVRAVAQDLLLISDVKYIITNVTKKSFQILMDRKADSDIPFSWHALAVNDPVTSKKKGDNLKSKIGADLGSDASSANSPTNAKGPSSAADPAAVGQSEASQAPSDSGASGNANGN